MKISRTDKYENEMKPLVTRIFDTQESQVLKKIEGKKSAEDIEKEEDLWSETVLLALYVSTFTGFFKRFLKRE